MTCRRDVQNTAQRSEGSICIPGNCTDAPNPQLHISTLRIAQMPPQSLALCQYPGNCTDTPNPWLHVSTQGTAQIPPIPGSIQYPGNCRYPQSLAPCQSMQVRTLGRFQVTQKQFYTI